MSDYDYDDDQTEFQNEADFDNYMNDEEYDLMSEMFPRAVKELKDYTHWDNLSVKLAIFDSDFDFDAAMIEIKRTAKKVKAKPEGMYTSTSPSSLRMCPSGCVFWDTNNSEPVKLSLAERLKQVREQRASEAAEVQNDKPVASSKSTALSGLAGLAKLKTNGTSGGLSGLGNRLNSTRNSPATSPSGVKVSSLSQKLASLQRKPLDASTHASISTPKQSQGSLSSRLAQLKRQKAETPIVKPQIVEEVSIEDRKAQLNLIATPVLIDPAPLVVENTPLFSISAFFQPLSRKRKLGDDTYTVYYPNAKAAKQAQAKFAEPSPDDKVLAKQAQAFNEVTESVAELELESEPAKISYKKSNVATAPLKKIDLKALCGERKPHATFVVIGHIDAGKSTLMGRLLYDVGAVDEKLIRKLRKESTIIGKSSFAWAWVMDQTSEERSRGVTIDICTSEFTTDKCSFTIVDAPGHKDFVPNAIAGVSQADIAVLVVDAAEGGFESSFSPGGQIREHILLARSMGVAKFIVAVNKMDMVDYYEGRYNDIKHEMTALFDTVGVTNVSFVCLSATNGVNVVNGGLKQDWYQDGTLVGQLETASLALQRPAVTDPFMFSVLDVSTSGRDTSLTGKVQQGVIQPGESVTVYPSEQTCKVHGVSTGDAAIAGDTAILKLRDLENPADVLPGDIIVVNTMPDLPVVDTISAQILTFDLQRPLLPGTPFVLFKGASQQPARLKKIQNITDNKGKTIKKKHLSSNQSAVVEMELVERPLPLTQNKTMSRIVLRKEGSTIGAGVMVVE